MEIKEIKIPVPWGFIAAKAWGDAADQPVIAIHGYQDNCNSFDTLIPLLPKSYYYICIDLPSHGRSTHIPVPIFINFFDFVVILKLVLDYLNRKRYILLGHSFGAQTELIFTQIYPEYVLKLIMLDSTYYIPVDPEQCFQNLKHMIDKYYKSLTIIDDSSAPTYSLEEAVAKFQNSRYSFISTRNANILVERSLISVGDGKYRISTAQHMKYAHNPPFTVDYDVQLLELYPVTCPHLIIMAKQTNFFAKMSKPLFDVFEKSKNFSVVTLDGAHYIHMETPELVAPVISKFLLQQSGKL